jgi:hypothetical protein
MISKRLPDPIRKYAALLAVIALFLSVCLPMPGMLDGGNGSDICVQSGLGQPGSEPVADLHQQCDLCIIHCHLGGLAPVDRIAALGRLAPGAGLDFFAPGYVSAHFSAYSPLNPRAPPVSA